MTYGGRHTLFFCRELEVQYEQSDCPTMRFEDLI